MGALNKGGQLILCHQYIKIQIQNGGSWYETD